MIIIIIPYKILMIIIIIIIIITIVMKITIKNNDHYRSEEIENGLRGTRTIRN